MKEQVKVREEEKARDRQTERGQDKTVKGDGFRCQIESSVDRARYSVSVN